MMSFGFLHGLRLPSSFSIFILHPRIPLIIILHPRLPSHPPCWHRGKNFMLIYRGFIRRGITIDVHPNRTDWRSHGLAVTILLFHPPIPPCRHRRKTRAIKPRIFRRRGTCSRCATKSPPPRIPTTFYLRAAEAQDS